MLAARPECHVLIMASERQGSDETVSLERLREEVPVDSRRVHFVGFQPLRGVPAVVAGFHGACVFYGTVRAFGGAVRIHELRLPAGQFGYGTCPGSGQARRKTGFLCDFWDHDMLADMTTELLARSDAWAR